MSVNLSKLDISLDQFNAVANGKYNIGQIKLNQDGTGVYRTNNHKTWTIFNTTRIRMGSASSRREPMRTSTRTRSTTSFTTKSPKSLTESAPTSAMRSTRTSKSRARSAQTRNRTSRSTRMTTVWSR